MPTAFGISFIIGRLAACKTEADLRREWDNMGKDYKAAKEVQDFKEKMEGRINARPI